MRILVTGGAGFVGSAVVNRISDRSDVVVIVRSSTGEGRLDALPAHVAIHRVDLADQAATISAIDAIAADVVVHAAASRGHARSASERLAAWRDDVVATATLTEALRHRPPERFVHVCSSLVYRPSTSPLGEGAPLGPETHRGATKLAAAIAVEQWSAETGVPVVVVRPFSVYGPGQDPARVTATLLDALATGTPFAITSSESRRDFVHVSDVARCIDLAASSQASDGRVLNVGTGTETSIKELIAIAERVTGRTLVPARDPFPPTSPIRPHWRADPSVPAELLGWRAEIGLEEGLEMLWQSR